MREYESVFVLNPSVDDAQVDAEVEKIREFLVGQNSEITEIQKWGRRKLAYEVAKNKEGIYTLIRFQAEAGVPTELDRRYRLNENMLRYLTVLYEKPPVEETPETGTAGEAPAAPAPSAEGTKAEAPKAAGSKAAEAKTEDSKAADKGDSTESSGSSPAE